MSDFLQNLVNVPTDTSDPRFLFSGVLAEHHSLLVNLKALESLNTSLVRECNRAGYHYTEEKYDYLIGKISILEVKSQTQPNLNDFPEKIDKSDIMFSLANLGKPISNSFLDNSTYIPSDLLTMDIGIDDKYLALLSPSVATIITDIAYETNDSSTVNMPQDVMVGVVNNLLKIKRDSLIQSFGEGYGELVLPFLEYQIFLKENRITEQINRVKLIEQFLIETEVFDVPFSMLQYSNSLLWSSYFLNTYFVKGQEDIHFRKMIRDQWVASRMEELITRSLMFLNNVGTTS